LAHQCPGINPPFDRLGHPGHVAVRAFGQPGAKALAGLNRRFRRRDPAGVETERARLGAQGRQKSRSA
jgi:hypothetical protein